MGPWPSNTQRGHHVLIRHFLLVYIKPEIMARCAACTSRGTASSGQALWLPHRCVGERKEPGPGSRPQNTLITRWSAHVSFVLQIALLSFPRSSSRSRFVGTRTSAWSFRAGAGSKRTRIGLYHGYRMLEALITEKRETTPTAPCMSVPPSTDVNQHHGIPTTNTSPALPGAQSDSSWIIRPDMRRFFRERFFSVSPPRGPRVVQELDLWRPRFRSPRHRCKDPRPPHSPHPEMSARSARSKLVTHR